MSNNDIIQQIIETAFKKYKFSKLMDLIDRHIDSEFGSYVTGQPFASQTEKELAVQFFNERNLDQIKQQSFINFLKACANNELWQFEKMFIEPLNEPGALGINLIDESGFSTPIYTPNDLSARHDLNIVLDGSKLVFTDDDIAQLLPYLMHYRLTGLMPRTLIETPVMNIYQVTLDLFDGKVITVVCDSEDGVYDLVCDWLIEKGHRIDAYMNGETKYIGITADHYIEPTILTPDVL